MYKIAFQWGLKEADNPSSNVYWRTFPIRFSLACFANVACHVTTNGSRVLTTMFHLGAADGTNILMTELAGIDESTTGAYIIAIGV